MAHPCRLREPDVFLNALQHFPEEKADGVLCSQWNSKMKQAVAMTAPKHAGSGPFRLEQLSALLWGKVVERAVVG